jgi:hypothetical protein
MVKLRGKFVPINPQEWRERTDLTVNVGIGTGNEDEKREKLMMLAGMQEKLGLAFGLVGPQQGYAMFSDMAETMGFQMPEKYAMSPGSPEHQEAMQRKQQQQPNQLAEAEQVKANANMQIAQAKMQMEGQVKQMQAQQQQQIEMLNLQFKAQQADLDRKSREAIETAKLEVQAYLQGLQIDMGRPGIGGGLEQ